MDETTVALDVIPVGLERLRGGRRLAEPGTRRRRAAGGGAARGDPGVSLKLARAIIVIAETGLDMTRVLTADHLVL